MSEPALFEFASPEPVSPEPVSNDVAPADMLSQAYSHDQIRTALVKRINELSDDPAAEQAAIVILNLDNFRLVNDGYGHAVGDLVLNLALERLRDTVRADDMVGRIGGDEFIILLNQVSTPMVAHEICERLRTAIRQPMNSNDLALRTTASFGVALVGRHGDTADTLIRHATAAMTTIKRRGGDGVAAPAISEITSPAARLKLELDLREAMDLQEFELYYQPKFRVSDGSVMGAEALLRWHHPERGMVSPAEFIPVAEDTGLIVPLGDWVLREALGARQRWSSDPSLRSIPTVAVNISFRQFEGPGFLEVVQDAISRAGCEPHNLELELTETVLMLNAHSAIEIMRRLRGLGVGLSIDDFGTGYSSLNLLKRIPLSTLKIDRSFVKDLPSSREDIAITEAIVSLAKTLGFETVAEGVETQQQHDFLSSIGCDTVQGFLFAPPLPEDQFLALLRITERSGGLTGYSSEAALAAAVSGQA